MSCVPTSSQGGLVLSCSQDSTKAFYAVLHNWRLKSNPGFIASKVCLKARAFSGTCPSVKFVQVIHVHMNVCYVLRNNSHFQR